MPYAEFHRGYKRTALRADELIVALELPRPRAARHDYFRKVGTRRAQAISKVVLAASAERGASLRHVRVGLGSVAPTPIRALEVERGLEGRPLDAAAIDAAVRTLHANLEPIDDIRSTAGYRRAVAGRLLRQFLEGLSEVQGA